MSLEQLLNTEEFYFWYLLPTIVGIITIIVSAVLLIRHRTPGNIVVFVLVFLLLAFSQFILIQIFFYDFWPSFIPHLGTGLALLLVGLQIFSNRKTSLKRRL
jgi:hypothetical protein